MPRAYSSGGRVARVAAILNSSSCRPRAAGSDRHGGLSTFWRAGKWPGQALLCLLACTKSARGAASTFRYSLEHVRRALSIWSGFEVNTRAPQRSFSLCVEEP